MNTVTNNQPNTNNGLLNSNPAAPEAKLSPVTFQPGEIFMNIQAFEAAQRMIRPLSESDLVPVTFQKRPANCLIALETAQRIGASPMMVMQNLYIVYGRPSWSSKFLIATINTCGRFEPLKFELTSNGVCNNGVANVKCVAWTTPKGVTHDENGKPVTSKSPLELIVKTSFSLVNKLTASAVLTA